MVSSAATEVGDEAGTRAQPVDQAPRRPGVPWLFAPELDLSVLLVPAAVTVAGALIATRFGGPLAGGTTGWITQFVLGNSTHVILTFLLLWARPDVFRATPGQAKIVAVGSGVTFVLGTLLYAITAAFFPAWSDFAIVLPTLLSFQHSFSQAKGIWSLYNLRGKEFGFGPPTANERSLQQIFVPLALLLVAVRWFFVEVHAGAEIPFYPVMAGFEALLPAKAIWLLLGVWAVFGAALARVVLAGPRRHLPKAIYLATHVGVVALLLIAPIWGAVMSAAVHGLEYFALSYRMLSPKGEGDAARLRRVGLAMVTAMFPLFVVGLLNAPFAAWFGLTHRGGYDVARFALNGVVLAHYFADAFIYRFRIPEVRKVALHRLGFAG